MDQPLLSIVIIGKNEGATLARSLPVIAEEARTIGGEVILVDSASTDNSVHLALRHPGTVIRLEASPLLCPAGGRFIGTMHARGKFVFFLDGDMIPIPGWLRRGLAHFDRRPGLGGVIGRIYFVLPGEDLHDGHPEDFPLGMVQGMGLSGIYRKDVLDRVGSFHPYVRGEEEIELGYRITSAGYQLWRYDEPMAYHLDKLKGKAEFDQKAKYFAGTGQVLRAYAGTELAKRLIRSTMPVFIQQAVAVGGGLVLLGLLIAGELHWAAAFAGLALAGLGVLALWKGPTRVYLRIRSLVQITRHMLRGYRAGLQDPAGFASRVKWQVVTSGRDLPLKG